MIFYHWFIAYWAVCAIIVFIHAKKRIASGEIEEDALQNNVLFSMLGHVPSWAYTVVIVFGVIFSFLIVPLWCIQSLQYLFIKENHVR